VAVKRRDGSLGFRVAAHLDEAESLGPTGVAVHDHLGRRDRTVRLEHLPQLFL